MNLRYIGLVAAALRTSCAILRPLNQVVNPRTLDPNSAQLPACAVCLSFSTIVVFHTLLTFCCQQPCFANGISDSPCAPDNITCICVHTDAVFAAMEPCLLANCSTIDQLHTQRYAAIVCDVPVRDRSQRMILSIWTFFAFAFISVALRLISRTSPFGGYFGWDDWTILILLALTIPFNIALHYLTHYGFGQDIWMLEEYQIVTILKVRPRFIMCNFCP